MSSAQTIVFFGRKSKKLHRFFVFLSQLDTIVILLINSFDSWVLTSNVLILSISSSSNTIRYGYSFAYEKISTMPPLIEYCPGSVTKSTASNFSFSSNDSNFSISIVVFISKEIVFLINSDLLITFSDKASGYVIMIFFLLLLSLFRTSDLSNMFELLDSLNWNDLLCEAGKKSTTFF